MREGDEFRVLIEEEIQKLTYPNYPESLYKVVEYVLNIGGKRIRPIFTLLSHQLFNTDIHTSLKAAIGIEIFHNFTLLHDDIMDKSSIRRGKKTVHEKWNSNTAILCGDIMCIKSYKLISESQPSDLKEVLDIFHKAAQKVCVGQQYDIDFEHKKSVNINDYLRMIEYKTSALLAASLKIGAINGGSSKKEADLLYQFGKNIGIAFQLKDDFLDTFGEFNIFGKHIGNDIVSNKKTYLYLKALEDANDHQNKKLLKLFSNKMNSQDKIDSVKSIFIELDIPNKTTRLIEEYHQKALNHLEKIKSKRKIPLINFANVLIDRNN